MRRVGEKSLFYLLEVCQGLVLILLYMFARIYWWSHLGLDFSLWEVFWLLIQGLLLYFYSDFSWIISICCLSRKLSISSVSSKILAYKCLQYFLILLISVRSAVMYLISFLVFITGIFLSFIGLAKVLSILFNFSKNQGLVSPVFSTAFYITINSGKHK